MTATSSRLLQLLSLLQARRDWPGNELAAGSRSPAHDPPRHRAPARARLPGRVAHRPGRRLPLRAGTAMPPLLLDEDEAIAIAVGLRTAARASVTGIEETSVRALVKLEQVLPAHLRRRVAALARRRSRRQPRSDGRPRHLTAIAAACRDRERLRFAYVSRDGAETRRDVEPHALVNLGRRWYLVAWDRGREDWRTFRVDRLARPAATGVALRAALAARAPTPRPSSSEPLGRPRATRPASPCSPRPRSGRRSRSTGAASRSTSAASSAQRRLPGLAGRSRCPASTSRSTSRASSSSACASWLRGSSGRRRLRGSRGAGSATGCWRTVRARQLVAGGSCRRLTLLRLRRLRLRTCPPPPARAAPLPGRAPAPRPSAGVYSLRGRSSCAGSGAAALRRCIARPCSASAFASQRCARYPARGR